MEIQSNYEAARRRGPWLRGDAGGRVPVKVDSPALRWSGWYGAACWQRVCFGAGREDSSKPNFVGVRWLQATGILVGARPGVEEASRAC